MSQKRSVKTRFILDQLTFFFMGTLGFIAFILYTPLSTGNLYNESLKRFFEVVVFISYYVVAYKLIEYYSVEFKLVLRAQIERHKILLVVSPIIIIVILGIATFGLQETFGQIWQMFWGVLTIVVGAILVDITLNKSKGVKGFLQYIKNAKK